MSADADCVTLASARPPTRASVSVDGYAFRVDFQSSSNTLFAELERSFRHRGGGAESFVVRGKRTLAALLQRAASLSRALHSQAANNFQQAVAAELAKLPAGIAGTEVERPVRQRVGQDKFSSAMLDYWGALVR